MSFPGWIVVACGAAFSAFSALSLAMERHYENAYGRGRTPGRALPWLRGAGVAGLLLSCVASLAAAGRAQGWVLWCGVLTASALGVVLVQTYAARHTARAGWAGAALVLAAAATEAVAAAANISR